MGVNESSQIFSIDFGIVSSSLLQSCVRLFFPTMTPFHFIQKWIGYVIWGFLFKNIWVYDLGFFVHEN